ncbi:MAG: hypothetical protein ACRCYT_06940 [Cetobacterium sp.]
MKNKLILIFLIILISKCEVAKAHRRVKLRCVHDIIRIKEDRYIRFRDCKFDNYRHRNLYDDCEYKLGEIEDEILYGKGFRNINFIENEETESESEINDKNYDSFKKIKEKKVKN